MNADRPDNQASEHPHFYGRRRGHKLRPGRQRLIETLLPRLRLAPGDTVAADTARKFLTAYEDIWLEVGFGAGEHLIAQAEAHPRIGFIGCEPFVNGVAAALSAIDEQALSNIRLFDDDARLLLPHLPAACLGRVFVLFSDPWPKKRHHRRRFLNRETLDHLARLMKDDAELRFASDHPAYVRWALEHIVWHPDFVWPVRTKADWTAPPPDWSPTRYELKAKRGGARCVYLTVRRAARRGRVEAAV